MPDSAWSVFAVFLRLGLTSFGGPIAHLGYYRTEFVERRRWLSEAAYADLVALCQLLPGPASSQVGFAVGLSRGGLLGGVAAWLGFTLPSAVAMVLFAQGAAALTGPLSAGLLHGLQVAAVAVVAQAVWSMARSLCPDRPRATIAVVATLIVTAAPTAIGQIAAILAGAIAGAWLPREAPAVGAAARLPIPVPRGLAVAALVVFALFLIGLPIAAAVWAVPALAVADALYRAGALVFGGGHVVLPLLHASVVEPGWVSEDAFLSGYGAAQAVPGPLFTFAAYLGAIMTAPPSGWPGAALCLVAIFLPGLLLVLGVLPFWASLGRGALMRACLRGVNAAVVGVLLGALYDPVWTKAIGGPADFALALVAFALLVIWKAPPWLAVLVSAAGGAALFGR
ncbi:MAG TPA: chromate efflux transporter [Candidatus Acidoferrum sp.]|jgi:chromate transporter|nr:chromate efflux transporter [Candidatus Acidoferrum sp.]